MLLCLVLRFKVTKLNYVRATGVLLLIHINHICKTFVTAPKAGISFASE